MWPALLPMFVLVIIAGSTPWLDLIDDAHTSNSNWTRVTTRNKTQIIVSRLLYSSLEHSLLRVTNVPKIYLMRICLNADKEDKDLIKLSREKLSSFLFCITKS